MKNAQACSRNPLLADRAKPWPSSNDFHAGVPLTSAKEHPVNCSHARLNRTIRPRHSLRSSRVGRTPPA